MTAAINIYEMLKNWLLDEMAMQWGNSLALFLQGNFIALYQIGSDLRKAITESDYDKFAGFMYGVMTLRDNTLYKTKEVESVWARPGYGPFLYLIAMTVAGKDGLAANRVRGQVTPAANDVWRNFFEGAGKNYVTPIPLNNAHHPEEWLNHKYVINTPIQIQTMVRKSDVIFRRDVHGELKAGFYDMADSLLSNQMRSIYGESNANLFRPRR